MRTRPLMVSVPVLMVAASMGSGTRNAAPDRPCERRVKTMCKDGGATLKPAAGKPEAAVWASAAKRTVTRYRSRAASFSRRARG